MKETLICKIASLSELNARWEEETKSHEDDRENWNVWKRRTARRYAQGKILPYYGILNGRTVCEATAVLHPDAVQNSEGLTGNGSVYLCAFRTVEEMRSRGYFSRLFRFMMEDLRRRGFTQATLGVEASDEKNRAIYAHYGFCEHIKSGQEVYPDGTVIDVDYYRKSL